MVRCYRSQSAEVTPPRKPKCAYSGEQFWEHVQNVNPAQNRPHFKRHKILGIDPDQIMELI
jgi:hypothetical protein